jgi:hypothetical protein
MGLGVVRREGGGEEVECSSPCAPAPARRRVSGRPPHALRRPALLERKRKLEHSALFRLQHIALGVQRDGVRKHARALLSLSLLLSRCDGALVSGGGVRRARALSLSSTGDSWWWGGLFMSIEKGGRRKGGGLGREQFDRGRLGRRREGVGFLAVAGGGAGGGSHENKIKAHEARKPSCKSAGRCCHQSHTRHRE